MPTGPRSACRIFFDRSFRSHPPSIPRFAPFRPSSIICLVSCILFSLTQLAMVFHECTERLDFSSCHKLPLSYLAQRSQEPQVGHGDPHLAMICSRAVVDEPFETPDQLWGQTLRLDHNQSACGQRSTFLTPQLCLNNAVSMMSEHGDFKRNRLGPGAFAADHKWWIGTGRRLRFPRNL